ncbi:MAG: hypothetical protein R8G66_06230 [Cytophagales bacterium]|nr:hypothetical protein [Cytophagales bacterium]
MTDQDNYESLQRQIDVVIGKIGLHNTIFLLSTFIDETSIPVEQTQRLQMISQYLITRAIDVFELKEKMFFTSAIQEYREARMACYHLIKKYTGVSYSKIAEDFGLTKRNVLYNCNKCEERLSVPYYYQSFVDKYAILEKSIIKITSKLTKE